MAQVMSRSEELDHRLKTLKAEVDRLLDEIDLARTSGDVQRLGAILENKIEEMESVRKERYEAERQPDLFPGTGGLAPA
jgi:hypothetical protein